MPQGKQLGNELSLNVFDAGHDIALNRFKLSQAFKGHLISDVMAHVDQFTDSFINPNFTKIVTQF